jgi:PBP1b-binding outer membrane lipoprotein LpoB
MDLHSKENNYVALVIAAIILFALSLLACQAVEPNQSEDPKPTVKATEARVDTSDSPTCPWETAPSGVRYPNCTDSLPPTNHP